MKVEIDFFEYCFLLESCIPPKPIARTTFFIESINSHYDLMTDLERKNIYLWIKDAINKMFTKDSSSDELIDMWLARYNPDNQYEVTTLFEDQENINSCFKYKDSYYTGKYNFINDLYIIKINKKLYLNNIKE